MIRVAILAIALAAQGCPPSPSPPPSLDAGAKPVGDASTSSVAACAHLAALGCAEGTSANCAATIDHVIATRLTRIDVACIIASHDRAAVQACGPVCR
jgi:hypothetical protein